LIPGQELLTPLELEARAENWRRHRAGEPELEELELWRLIVRRHDEAKGVA